MWYDMHIPWISHSTIVIVLTCISTCMHLSHLLGVACDCCEYPEWAKSLESFQTIQRVPGESARLILLRFCTYLGFTYVRTYIQRWFMSTTHHNIRTYSHVQNHYRLILPSCCCTYIRTHYVHMYVHTYVCRCMPCPLLFLQDYRLVVVGHSLGGGVAAILSVLIKMHEKEVAPRLKSFGYSTPGCVFRWASECSSKRLWQCTCYIIIIIQYMQVQYYWVIFMLGYKCWGSLFV